METATAYIETFGCALDTLTEDGYRDHGHDPAIDCQWGYRCSICGTENLPCAEHAPRDFPGLQLAPCDAEPRHPRTWFYANDATEPPCMYCAFAAEAERHRGCAHSRHRAWRRWKVTGKLVTWGYSMGFVQGSGWSHGDGCDGCVTFTWGRSGYLLGWDRWKWQGLAGCLRRGHWPTGIDRCTGSYRELNFCVKCAPCPGCETCRPAELAAA